MKIVFATDLYFHGMGGVQIVTKRLAEGLAKKGNEVYVIAPSPELKDVKIKNSLVSAFGIFSFPIPFYPDYRFCLGLFSNAKVYKILKKIKPDVIHIQTSSAIALAAAAYAKRNTIPVVATAHITSDEYEYDFRDFRSLKLFIRKLVISSYKNIWDVASIITSPTRFTSNYFSKFVPKLKKVVTISNGVDLSRYKSSKVAENKIPLLLYVGRLDPIKHVETIIKAMPKIIEKQKVRLIIIGGGLQERKLKNLVKRLKLEVYIKFIGKIKEAEVINYYHQADVFILSSVIETQGLAALEAVASGLPVVLPKVGALPELVSNGRNGFLYKFDDTRELADDVLKIIDNKNLKNQMRKESLAIAKEHNMKDIVVKLMSLYRETGKTHLI